MATITRSYTENQASSYKATWTFTVTTNNVTASGATFSIAAPTVSASYSGSGKGYADVEYISIDGLSIGGTTTSSSFLYTCNVNSSGNPKAWTSGTSKTCSSGGSSSLNLNTSSFFSSSNSTSRTLNISVSSGYASTSSAANSTLTSHDNGYYGAITDWTDMATVTLNAPPSFSVSSISYDKAYVYSGLTTASVTISSAAAQYGGTISASSFTIGNQTVTGSGNGTLSILLANAGTFTPTVTVTDSRGQTTTQSLSPITVNGYATPTVSITAERTDTSGAADDEGQCAVVTANFDWTDVIADLNVPTVSIVDQNGASVSATTTWYKNRTLTTAVSNWTTLTSADMPVYGIIDNSGHNTFNTQYSYQITITPNDSIDSGTAISTTLDSAFYTVDFLAGGHGIAFGQPASQTGFYCNMDANFLDDADFGADVFIELPNYTTSSTTDKAIYDAIVALGWDSDVLIS